MECKVLFGGNSEQNDEDAWVSEFDSESRETLEELSY
jgi:hypothetical protein